MTQQRPQRTQPQQRAAQPPVEVTDSEGFHAALKDLGTRHVRYYPAITALFEPWAAAGKSEALSDGKRTRGSTFDPEVAALILVRAIDLAGLSTRSDIECGDEFEKSDAEFALELGITVHQFRAGRRFLTTDVQLLGRRDVRLPNRTFYRPLWSRIQQFFFGADAGMGWGQLPLVAGTGPPKSPAGAVTGSVTDAAGDEKANHGLRNNALGVAKKQTRGCEKANPFREDLYRNNSTEIQNDVDVVARDDRARANAKMAWAFSMDRFLQKTGIEAPASTELADKLADIWSDVRKPAEIADRVNQAVAAIHSIPGINSPIGFLIAEIRRDPLLTGKRFEVMKETS